MVWQVGKLPPKLYLAPMEGVVDWVIRDILTSIGGIDQCVTEFIRVTERLLPNEVFYRYCPELYTNSKTRAGTPVYVQLLGGDPGPLAENAALAAELGAAGIDLNFGCPAKTVNRHDGGAVLLKCPERIETIVAAVRKAVPPSIPVTAKIRLGFESPEICIDNAQAAQAGGASHLTVHCRTKMDMYRPPAYWEWIPRIKEKTSIPLIANGEIWSVNDFSKCATVTSCDLFMIGRGALCNPYLFRQIKGLHGVTLWSEIQSLIIPFFLASTKFRSDNYAVARTKQWLAQLRKMHVEAADLFENIKRIHNPEEFLRKLTETTAIRVSGPSFLSPDQRQESFY